MSKEPRGRVVMRSKAPRALEDELVSLLIQLSSDVSATQLLNRIRKPPFIIRNDVAAEDGVEIAAYFQAMGGDVVFVPHSAPAPAPVSSGPTPVPQQPAAPAAERPETPTSDSDSDLEFPSPVRSVVRTAKGLPPVLKRILRNHAARQVSGFAGPETQE